MKKKWIIILAGIMVVLLLVPLGVRFALRFRLEAYSKNIPIRSVMMTSCDNVFAIDDSETCYTGSFPYPNGLGKKREELLEFCHKWMLFDGMVKFFENVVHAEQNSLITKDGRLFAFSYFVHPGYETPKLIQKNVLYSFTLNDVIYFIDWNGGLFSFDFSTERIREYPIENVASLNGVQINQKEYLFFLQTNGVLSVYEKTEEGFSTPIKRYENVKDFSVSVSSVDFSETGRDAYLLGIIKTDGTVWIDGRLSWATDEARQEYFDVEMQQIEGTAEKIACYPHGILYLDKEKLHIYGYDITGVGEKLMDGVLRENVKDFAAGYFSACVVDTDGSLWMWGDTLKSTHKSFEGKPWRVQ